MAVGDRIKRARKFRNMSLRELGVALGFDEKSADVRIAQYESNKRTPKKDLLERIAEVLDVNYRALYEPTLYAAEDVMYTLFELDEHYPISIHKVIDDSDPYYLEEHMSVNFNYELLDGFFKEWLIRKQELQDGAISKEQYEEWKLNWPATADDCGKHSPRKKWRK